MTASPLADPATLRPLGATPDEARSRLAHELGRFGAHLPTRQADWTQVQMGRDWTPAQEAEHVILVNGLTAGVLRLLTSDKPLRAGAQVPGELQGGKRLAPQGTEPSAGGQPWAGLDAAWARSAEGLTAAAAGVTDHAERRFWHPFFGEISALDWLRMVVFHVRTHRQLLEASAGGPGAGKQESRP